MEQVEFVSARRQRKVSFDVDEKMSKVPFDHEQLIELANMKMPFGKYAGRLLVDLPEPYVVWFSQKGFPNGKLGQMLAIVYEIKVNGLEYLFDPLRSSDQ